MVTTPILRMDIVSHIGILLTALFKSLYGIQVKLQPDDVDRSSYGLSQFRLFAGLGLRTPTALTPATLTTALTPKVCRMTALRELDVMFYKPSDLSPL